MEITSSAWTQALGRGLKLLTADKQLINDDHLMGSCVTCGGCCVLSWRTDMYSFVLICVPMTELERS